MKEGLLGGALCVSPKSELEEARLRVARRIGSKSQEARRVSALCDGRLVQNWVDSASVSVEASRMGTARSQRSVEMHLVGHAGISAREHS